MWFIKVSRKKRDAHLAAGALVVALLVAVLFSASGLSDGVERQLRDARDTLRIAPASGEIAIVEIDGRSLQALPRWPWPRSLHAQAITELDRLGAAQIAFDVEFSARVDPVGDKDFADALSSISQPTILPTFRQQNRAGDEVIISESLPLEEFRESAFLASVNVRAAPDGQIKHYSFGETTNGTPRPSMANMLARSGGEVDSAFRIDPAIDPATIPRISFVDLVEGRVAESAVDGKRIIFGNTAIELGDRYPTALFGVQPGVIVHVQAAETLMQGRVRADASGTAMLSLIALLVAGGLFLRIRYAPNSRWFTPTGLSLGMAGGFIGLALALDQASSVYLPIGGSLVFLVAFAGLRKILVTAATLQAERLTDTASGLPNIRAMQAAKRSKLSLQISAMRIADFSDVTTMLSVKEKAQLDRAIAHRLSVLADNGDIYRIDGGVFAWFMVPSSDQEQEQGFEAAHALFNAPLEVGDERLRLVPHFGTASDSIGQAVDASELARKRGLIWSANAEELYEESQYRQRILAELDEALQDGSISVVFQPKLRMTDGAIKGGECLVRWHSAQLGQISPAQFIPILEQKGRIFDLTMFVLREAMKRQKEAASAGHAINLAVNVSAQLLSDKAFVATLIEELNAFGAAKNGGITLEITESAPLEDSSTAREALTQMREAGARISIDDYGTGQATLNYLQGFPAQEIKLDQSFIRDLVEDRKDQIMVQSTIDLAHALGFELVAEGVETQAILDILTELGCDYAQGWHIGKPMAWDDFAAFLGSESTPAKPIAQVNAAA